MKPITHILMKYRLKYFLLRAVTASVVLAVIASSTAPAFAVSDEYVPDSALNVRPATTRELVPDRQADVPVLPDESPPSVVDPTHSGETAGNTIPSAEIGNREPIEPAPVPEERLADPKPSGNGGGPPAQLSDPPDPPYSSVQPVPNAYQVRPDVDQSTGALTYRYPITLPPGRGGMTPELSLTYNSQDRRDGSFVGYGWNLSLLTIERQNIAGLTTYYSDEYFTSGFSGELTRIAAGGGPNNFAARVDDGSFVQYTFASSSLSSSWVAATKDGTRYFFGSSVNSRLYDTGVDPDATKVAKWFLDRIEDKNGNRINFSYVRDANQLYLDTITYTDTALGTGPFLITFIRELRPDADQHISYANSFRIQTRYRVTEVQTRVSGILTGTYAFGYTTSQGSNRSLLSNIIQTGYDSTGTPTTLPPTAFSYTPSTFSFVAANPNPFATVTELATSSLRHGFMITDINSDGYADLARFWEREGSTNVRRVWLNDHEGSLAESAAWTGISSLPAICAEDPATLLCAAEGVAIFDRNGDLLPDFYKASGVASALALNLGIGWGEFLDHGPAYSMVGTYNYRPSSAPYDGANPPYVLEPSESNGIGEAFGTVSNRGNRVADVNHDGLPDVVRSIGSPDQPTGLDERVYLSTGIDGGGVVRFTEIDWLFLNGTSTGANAPAANAVFEHTAPKAGSLADFNGDDLPDAVIGGNKIYFHTGNTWAYSTTIALTTPIEETQLADFNGDGFLDLVVSDGCGFLPGACNTRLLLNTATAPSELLQTITLPAGGVITATYKASSLYKDGSGSLLNPNLPIVIQTVASITETDSVLGVSGMTTYEYAGGRYFFKSLTDRRFAGFNQVTALKPDGAKHITYFNVTEEGKIGKSYRTDLLGVGGASLARTLTDWSATPLASLGNSRFLTTPASTVTMDFNDIGVHRDRAQSFSYNLQTGALLETLDYGEVSADAATSTPVFTDIGGDARTTVFTYATNASGLEFPSTQTLTDYT
ncbi:MAG: SpvB/TcaC N-terminal domain-containing protein, partial [Patescibacteria group bacterium]